MRVAIVIVEDRHCDADAIPFDTAEKAIAYAKKTMRESAEHYHATESEINEALTASMEMAGWLYYGCIEDGCSARVFEKEVQ